MYESGRHTTEYKHLAASILPLDVTHYAVCSKPGKIPGSYDGEYEV